MKAKLLLLLGLLLLPTLAQAQTVDRQKLDSLATAVAHAEGFGVRRAIPTKYHNPGDLKSAAIYKRLPGQKRLGKGGHIVFADDAAGWAALRDYLSRMVDGRSRRFNPDMTLIQVSRVYAGNWRPWVRTVSRELGVPPSATLRDVLCADDPPVLADPPAPRDLPLVASEVPPPLPGDNRFPEGNFQY